MPEITTVSGALSVNGSGLILGSYYGDNNTTFVKASLGRNRLFTEWLSNSTVGFSAPWGVGGPYPMYLAVHNQSSLPMDFEYYRM